MIDCRPAISYKEVVNNHEPHLDGLFAPQEPELLRAQLLNHLPADAIYSDAEALRPFECDGLTAHRQLPLLAVLPQNKQQIAGVLGVCRRFGVPVVTRGAGTGLSGGALPHVQGVLMVLSRMRCIISIDPQDLTATVEPGVRNQAISDAVARHGLHYAPDPSSQIACSIGGNVAENAGGVHCLKYGLTVNNLQGLEFMTMAGDVLSVDVDDPGFDIAAVLTGSEGLLGVITEITVRLTPNPEAAQLLVAAFSSLTEAGRAVADIVGSGLLPSGLEMMDKLALQAAEAFAGVGYPTDAEALILCELDGMPSAVNQEMTLVKSIVQQAGAVDVTVSQDESHRVRLWAGRKNAFPAMGRLAPDYYCMDGTIPRRCLAEVLDGISQLSNAYDLPVANVFHAGDGNLHPLILFDANDRSQAQRAEDFGGKILELCIEVGGTITGEHGVGREKINQMCIQFSTQELQQFHALRKAFDPDELMNPGKAVPTLNRCAEFGRMHVHHGRMPFPELPRF